MAGYQIKPLSSLAPEDIRCMNIGYTSPARYTVCKVETPEHTQISIDLEELATPYVKAWETDDEELAMLQAAVLEGLSYAVYSGEELVGIAIAEARRWQRTLWLYEFHVAEGHRRQGIGRSLMEVVAEKGRQAGLRILALETQSTNLPAIRFYRALGFELGGIDLSYYTNHDLDGGEVAIFMKRRIE